jgi:enamine deaminase RidA (YjgF/YER057c/UK114 family)
MMQVNTSYIKGQGITIEEQITDIFSVYKQKGITIRLVFFGNPLNNKEYMTHLRLISQSVRLNFGDEPPVFSYVAQPPLEENPLVMEVVEIIPGTGTQVYYKRRKEIPYIIIESSRTKKLFLGGVKADCLDLSIRKQSDAIFSRLEEIFSWEKMPIFSIIRQWNYIEQIVKKADGRQNYQDFNDSRTRFYNKTTWENGYPAATGVGTSCGGVMIDLEALLSYDPDIKIIALNNSLQVPAHAYSPCVLIGKEDGETGKKTTPKFERAKLVRNEKKGIIYVSGTAAIRGEMSLENVGIEEQTKITLENIEHLISNGTLVTAGIENVSHTRLCCLRVYLKEEHFFESAKRIIEGKYAGLPSIYLKGDVCREELLVEIEGLASLDF